MNIFFKVLHEVKGVLYEEHFQAKIFGTFWHYRYDNGNGIYIGKLYVNDGENGSIPI
jgi:hypothetical protein